MMLPPKDNLSELMSEVLDTQIEGTEGHYISAERLREALTVGPTFSNTEKRLLWQSPLVRDVYLRVKSEIIDEIKELWREQSLDTSLEVRVAQGSNDQAQPTILESPSGDYSVKIIPLGGADTPLMISLSLGPRICRSLSPRTIVQLIDSGGLVWLEGVPNAQGEIVREWTHEDETPGDRLSHFKLDLDVR